MHTPPSTEVLCDRYRLGELLGRGGMAEVFDGWDERLRRPVAVKMLRPALAARPEVRSRFEVEGRAAAQLSHPNVVAVYDTGSHGGLPFLVLERLPGETLGDRMADGPLHEDVVRRMALEIAGALGAAHAAGIVHRDVKPANILIAADGSAKVGDFGIAKSAESAAGDATTAGVVLGTPAYLAPERVDGHPATARSDLYSLGVVLYEALAGVKPFQAATPMAMAAAIQTLAPLPLAKARPGVDAGLAAAVDAAMAREPAARPPTAAAMAILLRARPPPAIGSPTVLAPALDSTMPMTPPSSRGRGAWALVAAAAGVLVVLLAAAALGRGSGTAVAGDTSGASVLRDLAARVEVGDGPRGPEAADRLRTIADRVGTGGDAIDESRALLAEATAWHAARTLSTAATTELVAVLGALPGIGPVPALPPATQPAAPAPPAVARPAGDGGDDDDGEHGSERGDRPGKRKGRSGDDG